MSDKEKKEGHPKKSDEKDRELSPKGEGLRKKENLKKENVEENDEDNAEILSQQAEDATFIEKVISINRITKVTKGGKKLSFSALVVVGDTKGKVGYSLSKAGEVSIAIRKAMVEAKRNMIDVPLRGTTIPHEIIGICGGANVLLKPASDGTGVIASGPVRAVCDGAGIHNILTKVHRSNNPINVVKATFDGLSRLKSANQN
ncbi:MAG: 30S ribosomal protein S5 [Candidatus Omnitrophica bacterium]|nr:30S ribosomal protein S5 [Candidatus Omnitrophota bacterium]MCB9747664.1 30S ribosomal protein S5 [Candidatus Omnitrophota bacterium]